MNRENGAGGTLMGRPEGRVTRGEAFMRRAAAVGISLCVFSVLGCSSDGGAGSFRAGLSTLLESGSLREGLSNAPLTEQDVAKGLLQALRSGIRDSTERASRTNGYLNHPDLRIPVPPSVQGVTSRLRDIGLGRMVDDFEAALNHAAEDAAKTAQPIFLEALRSLTITDAWAILQGEDDAATAYLRRETGDELRAAFSPKVAASLERVGCTRLSKDLLARYNRIPLVEKIEFDLTRYTTTRAVDGLFFLVAEEEKNIRENPVARTTELMRRVFGRKAFPRG